MDAEKRKLVETDKRQLSKAGSLRSPGAHAASVGEPPEVSAKKRLQLARAAAPRLPQRPPSKAQQPSTIKAAVPVKSPTPKYGTRRKQSAASNGTQTGWNKEDERRRREWGEKALTQANLAETQLAASTSPAAAL